MKHYTTIEQSKKLLELGLNPESADMYFSLWEEDPNFKEVDMMESAPFEWKEITVYDRALPCWSLGALLELMPTGAHIEKRNNNYACYIVYNKPYEADTPIEAVYSMIVWLLENNYIAK